MMPALDFPAESRFEAAPTPQHQREEGVAPLSELTAVDLLSAASELSTIEEAANAQCIDNAREKLAENTEKIFPVIRDELASDIEQRYPGEVPKAPNQSSHPAMDAEKRAQYQERHGEIVNKSKSTFLEKIRGHEPDDLQLVSENKLRSTLGDIKKGLREQAKASAQIVTELNSPLPPPSETSSDPIEDGPIKRMASWAIKKFGIERQPPDVVVDNGSEEDLREALIDLVNALAALRDPEQLGQMVTSRHIDKLPQEAKKRLSRQYRPWEEEALEDLNDELAGLLEEAKGQSSGRVDKNGKKPRRSEQSKTIDKPPKGLGEAQEAASKQSGDRADIPSGLTVSQAISAFEQLGCIVRNGGKHPIIYNPGTGMSTALGRGLIKDPKGTKKVLKEIGMSYQEFVEKL
ncbi:hypothetical protein KY385_01465 [Candidatus Parcubacteria bacterium]|nr:hypothetical protein [Candidatus Parcubacteria bacterium]